MLYILILLTAFPAIPGTALQQDQENTLVVDLINLRSDKGKVLISIYNDPETFPEDDIMLEQKILSFVSADSMRIFFDELTPGTYAIAAMHDENGDEKMNFNLIGMPKEGYCFSNNVRPKLRKPTWEEAKFQIGREDRHIRIIMKY
jgi:uncharacterized protein (DUF2141 family)